MRNGSNSWWIPAALLGGVFAWGLFQFISAPLETGDVYPPYSSLRSDPLGSKALYESLEAVGEVKVSRLYQPRETLEGKRDAVFVLGVDPVSWTDLKFDTLEEYEKLARSGVRLIIGFLPVRAGFVQLHALAVEGRWRLRLGYRSGYVDHISHAIPRRSALAFYPMPADGSADGSAWRVLGEREDAATVVERAFGAGSIVLIADTYPLSNEGLREERSAALVAAIVGDREEVVFDESHFGVEDTGSVTTLMRRYHLEGALAVLGVVAILFLWRSTSSFLPPRQAQRASSVDGRGSLDGFAALLERNLAGQNALSACWTEWKRSAPRDLPETCLSEAEARMSRPGSDSLETYRAMSRILREKR